MTALALQSVSVQYGSGARAFTAVDGIDLTIEPGAALGLVGETGSGKSTIAKAIVGLARVSSGRVLLGDEDVTNAGGRRLRFLRDTVQMVFQDPYASLNPRMVVGETLEEAIQAHRDLSRKERQNEASRLLDLVGLDPAVLDRYPHQFSGGQRQRIAIARSLAAHPKILILDEVTSSLDVSVQSQILNLLHELRGSIGIGYLFISHDLSLIRYMCDTVAVMYLGWIVEKAATLELFARPEHPYTRMLLDSVPDVHRTGGTLSPLIGDIPDPRDPPSGCRFRSRCPIGPRFCPERAVCVEIDPREEQSADAHHVACHFRGAVSVTPRDHRSTALGGRSENWDAG